MFQKKLCKRHYVVEEDIKKFVIPSFSSFPQIGCICSFTWKLGGIWRVVFNINDIKILAWFAKYNMHAQTSVNLKLKYDEESIVML